MFKRSLAQVVWFMLIDALLVIASFFVAYYLRFNVFIDVMPGHVPTLWQYFRMVVFVAIIWVAILKMSGLYDKKHFSLLDEAALIIWSLFLGGFIFVGLLYIYQEFWFSRQVLGFAAIISAVMIVLFRFVYTEIESRLHRRGIGIKRIIIIGAGEIGQALAHKVSANQDLGYQVAGFLDDDAEHAGKTYYGFPVLGGTEKVSAIINQERIDEIIIADAKLPSAKILDIITGAESKPIEFKIVPGILEIMASRVDTDEIGGIPLVSISMVQWHGFKAIIKRAFDLVVAGAVITILSPVLLITAMLIKFDSRGPIVFSQPRVGRNGQLFNAYKFRSMVPDAENKLREIEHLSDTEGHIFKMKNDPRVTRIGRFIRRFSIDELPQLFNVIKGEMSLVGPRPPLPREVNKYNSWEKKRLRIAPGLTGLWQVSGRSQLPFSDMVRLDIYYIENWSLWLDFKIIFKTIPVVFFGSGAY